MCIDTKMGNFCVLFNNRFLYKDNNQIVIYQNGEKLTLVERLTLCTSSFCCSIIQINENTICCISNPSIWLFSINNFYVPKAEIINKDNNKMWYHCFMWNGKLLVLGDLDLTIINIETFQIETIICFEISRRTFGGFTRNKGILFFDEIKNIKSINKTVFDYLYYPLKDYKEISSIFKPQLLVYGKFQFIMIYKKKEKRFFFQKDSLFNNIK